VCLCRTRCLGPLATIGFQGAAHCGASRAVSARSSVLGLPPSPAGFQDTARQRCCKNHCVVHRCSRRSGVDRRSPASKHDPAGLPDSAGIAPLPPHEPQDIRFGRSVLRAPLHGFNCTGAAGIHPWTSTFMFLGFGLLHPVHTSSFARSCSAIGESLASEDLLPLASERLRASVSRPAQGARTSADRVRPQMARDRLRACSWPDPQWFHVPF
jgi:hypothetical protein